MARRAQQVGPRVGALVWAGGGLALALVAALTFGALGALAPTMREGSQFTFVLLLPQYRPLEKDENRPI